MTTNTLTVMAAIIGALGIGLAYMGVTLYPVWLGAAGIMMAIVLHYDLKE